MLTILVALGDVTLAEVVGGCLRAAGHAALPVQRPLALLTEARRTAWDVALVDDSPLGRDALSVISGLTPAAPIAGIALEDARLSLSLPVPFDARALAAALIALSGRGESVLTLRPERRVALANALEVSLTRAESRLLDALLKNRPHEVSIAQAMDAIWGDPIGTGTPAALRGHIRNLRFKLGRIGLPDCVRSSRGRGYSLVL